MPADFRKSKLGFANPLIPNSNDISYDPYDLQDPTTASKIKAANKDVFKRRNVFKGTNEFSGLVITPPEDLISSIVSGVYTAFQIGVGENVQIIRLKVHVPELHACLGNPCDIGHYERATSEKEKLAIAEQIIENHPWVTARVKFFDKPVFGDIVKIKFSKGPVSGKMTDAEIVKVLSRGNSESIKTYCDDSIANKYQNTIPIPFFNFFNPTSLLGYNTNTSGLQVGVNSGCAGEVFEIIASGEGNYNSMNRGKSGDSPGGAFKWLGKNLTEFTISEIKKLQSKPNRKLFAAGKYQIIPDTMLGFLRNMNIPDNSLFNEATQELFPPYVLDIKRPEVGKYISGLSSNKSLAIQELAKEFASVGIDYPENGKQRGQSYYAGSGNNRASISPDEIGAALDRARVKCNGNADWRR